MSDTKSKKKSDSIIGKIFQGRTPHVIVFAFSFLIYCNTIPNLYNLDDELVTTTSAAKPHRITSKGIGAIPQIFREPYYSDQQRYAYDYRPMVLATFAIEHSLFGDNPHVSHFINVLFYSLLCVLLYVTLSHLFREYNPLLALLATLLFAAYPLHTEVVASIKNRDEIMSLAGGIGALFFFYHYVQQKKILLLPVAAACFAFGMLSKTTGMSFIVIIPALLILFATPSLKQVLLIAAILCAVVFPFIQKAFWDERIAIMGGAILFSASIYQIRNPVIIKLVVQSISRWREILKDFKNKIASEFKTGATAEGFQLGYVTTLILFIVLAALALIFFLASSFKYAFPPFLYIIPLVGFFPLSVFAHPKIKIYLTWLCLGVGVYTIDRTANLSLVTFLFHFFIYNLVTERKRKIQSLIIILLLFASTPPTFSSSENIILMIIVIGATGIAFTSYFSWFKWVALAVVILPLKGPLTGITYVISGFLQPKLITVLIILLIFFSPGRRGWIVSLITVSMLVILLTNTYSLQTNVHVQVPNYKRTFVPVGGSDIHRPIDYVENVVTGETPFSEKVGTGMIIIGKYMQLTAFPYPMSFYYGYKIIEKKDIGELLPLFIAAMVAWLLAAAFIGFNKIPLLSAALLIYLLSIFPVANIVIAIPGMMADRFLFIPSLGFCILLAYLSLRLFKIPQGKNDFALALRNLPGYFKYTMLAILLLFSGMTVARNSQWHDTLTLMRHDIKHLDESAQAHNLLASNLVITALADANTQSGSRLVQEAESHYEKAIAIYPKFFNATYDLGRVKMMLGKLDEAEAVFIKASEMDSTFAAPFFQIGLLKENKKDYRGAIPYYSKYLQLMPGNFDALTSLSFCYAQILDLQSALVIMKKATELYPQREEPLINQCRIFADIGMMDSARFYLHRAEILAPAHPDVIMLKKDFEKEGTPASNR